MVNAMTNAIIPAAIRLHDRPLLDMTHDSVEVSHCVPKYGTLRTDAAGIYFDHSDGNTYHWSRPLPGRSSASKRQRHGV